MKTLDEYLEEQLKNEQFKKEWEKIQVEMERGLRFKDILSEKIITRTEAKKAFHDLRKQASDVAEMSLEEINVEISFIRAERKNILKKV